jgi:SAM-dependent methyltransferase
MDTGGGEFLSSLRPLPKTTYATEGYAPNIPVAKRRLEPLGIKVIETLDGKDSLPFPARFFDLVINRHGSYSPPEIYRILKPNGLFIIQQVGGQNNFEINEMLQDFPEFIYSHWTLNLAVDQLLAAGFEILEQREEFPEGRIFDIGALIYYLKLVSWQIADFSIERYYQKLAALHNQIQENREIKVRSHLFLIVAKKPSS